MSMKRYVCLYFLWAFTLALWAQSTGGYGGDYNPTNPADPNDPSFTLKYNLSVTVSGGGNIRISPSGTEFTRGTNISLYANPDAGYKFSCWKQGDLVVSTSQQFDFAMPGSDVEYHAVFVYDPDVPANPDVIPLTYDVTAEASPSHAGSVSYPSTGVTTGHETSISASPKSGYQFKGWFYQGDLISNNNTYRFQMPDKDMHFVALFEYQPTLPDNPNNNIGVSDYYTLTYVLDGEVIYSELLPAGATIASVKPLSKNGYRFSGWNKKTTVMPSHDLTLEGTFIINSYKLTYKIGNEVYKTDSIVYGAPIPFVEEPTKDGYSFNGWKNVPKEMPFYDLVIEGSFTPNKYDITYIVDGTEYKTVSVGYETVVPYLDAPTKEGYTFVGWDGIPTTMPAKNIRVNGVYTKNCYKLTYEVDGEIYYTDSILYETSIIPIDNPTKEGHSFSGWKNLPTTMPAKDVTITGFFNVNNYTLTYVVDGVTFKTETITFGAPIIALKNPVKEGHSFSGWSEIPATMPASDKIITGSFTANSYTITYILEGETLKVDTITYGTTISVPDVSTKEGYSFSGWDNIPATMPAKDITVNGSYSINRYNLTYVIDGEVYKSDSITYSDAITPIDSPIKEGHTFSGWRNVPATMPAQDVIINGSFSINSYNVTYVLDGEVYSKETYLYGAPIIPIDTPSKEGYSFSGWTNLPTNMPAQDVTTSGKFNINSYKLTYMVDGEVYRTETYLYGSIINPINPPTKEGYISRWKNIPMTMPAEDSVCEIEYILNSTQIDEQGIIYTPSETGETFMVSSFTNTLVEEVVIPTELYSLPVTAILDNALSGATTMKSLVIPASIKSVGNQAFSGCNNLLVIEWNTELPLEATCFDEPEKYGNMLVFTNSEGTFAGNVITNGTAEEILLLDGQPFRNPKQFTAKQISYTRKFSKKTKVGTAGGWEGIVLPFDVQKIAHEGKGVLEPFGVTDFTTSLPCWIGEWLRSSSSFVLTRSNLANQPFIMEVPNSEDYEEKFNIEGDVTFSAENAIVYATTENNSVNTNRVTICGTYEGVTASPLVYALNDEEYTAPDGNKFMPGGVFVADSRDIRPFEAYAYNALLTHTRYMPIQGRMATSIDRILLKEKTDDDTWYTIQGIRLKSKPTQKGLYIHNGKTIVIK